MFYLALYKGDGNYMNSLIRWWDCGIYSHCELVFSDGMSASASFRDSMEVRMKRISYDPNNWDYIELPSELESYARSFYESTKGMPYDLFGQLRFFVSPLGVSKDTYWCSNWVASALGMPEPWRYGPNGLAAAVNFALR